MAINNIDSQFAAARAEVRALINHCNPNTNIGGQSIEVLQSIVDTLDAIQNDSYKSSEGFHRYPPVEDRPVNPDDEPTNPNFQAFKDLEAMRQTDPDEEVTSPSLQTLKALEEARQTDRLC